MEDLRRPERGILGKKGEDLALEFLLEKGMVLLARNWRCGHKELDLVMEDGNFIRVVEVKTRSWPAMADPLENVDHAKRRRIISAARGFLGTMKRNGRLTAGKEVVFDVVSILFNGEAFKVEYIRDACAPTW